MLEESAKICGTTEELIQLVQGNFLEDEKVELILRLKRWTGRGGAFPAERRVCGKTQRLEIVWRSGWNGASFGLDQK